MTQGDLFGDGIDSLAPERRAPRRMRVLVTVTTAPNPSETHGETVCVAGIELGDLGPRRWVRLYPINLRHLRNDGKGFRKYDVISVDVRPATRDSRVESWKPDMDSLTIEGHLTGWPARQPYVAPLVGDSMCQLAEAAKGSPTSKSLGFVRPQTILGLDVERHPGWSADEQRKIDAYANQLDLFDDRDRQPLEAPRFKAHHRFRCSGPNCSGHRMQNLDWELVAFQRQPQLAGLDDAMLASAIRAKFLDEICAPDRNVAFYVGNLAKRRHTFSILGAYYPKRMG